MRIRMVLGALAAACALGAGAETLDTTGFAHRCAVTFSGYTGTSTLADFPALVRIPAGSPVYGDSADGQNIRFADAAGNLVPCEIDTWNTNGESTVWVRVPELTSAGAALTLYCGGTPAQDARAREVWAGADYRGVWHFSGNAHDSSTNNLSCKTSSTPPDFTQKGPVGTSFYGTGSRYVYVPNAPAWNDYDGTNFTVSGWVKATALGHWRIVSTKKAYQDATGFEITMQNHQQQMMVGGPGTKQTIKDVNRNMLAEFVYFTAIYRDGNMQFYVDGAKIADVTNGYTVVASDKALGIGTTGGSLGNSSWTGWMDEVRFQGRAQSEDWALADYATQVGSLGATFGAFETLAGRAVLNTSRFGKRCTVTFSGYTGTTALENFPALVRIPASVARFCAYNGSDVRFADADGFAIPHEIDTWNPQGESTVWVRVPRLEGTDTTVTMYFAGVPDQTVNGRDVWNAGYKGVWHFAGEKQDSSPNALKMYASGTMSYTTAGPVGTAFQALYSGFLYTSNNVNWAGFDNTGFTVSCWFKGASAVQMRLVSTKANWNDANGFEVTTQGTDAHAFTVHGRSNSQAFYASAPDYTADFIHLVTVYHDNSADLYVNGVLAKTVSDELYNVTSVTGALVIAGIPWSRQFNGQLDEVRLQWAAPSADWVKADYDTQRAGSGFAVVGPVTAVGAGPVLETRAFRRRAVVAFAGQAGAGPLVDFPALLRLPVGSPVYAGAAADGSDLRFTDLEGHLLPHEIDTWNTNGESTVWVRVPELLSTGARVHLYWSPKGTAPAASAESVWARAGYRAVFHFSGTHADATGNAVEVSEAGAPSFAGVGKVGTAFSGNADSYLMVPNNLNWADLAGRDLTLSCWVKSDWAQGENSRCDRIFSCKYAHNDDTGFELTTQIYSTRYNLIGGGNAQHTTPVEDTRADCATGLVYLTAIIQNSQAFIYANGELLKTGAANECPLRATREWLRIGANLYGSNKWKGQIDEARLRWGASTPDWVAADYAAQNDLSFSRLESVVELYTGTVVILR